MLKNISNLLGILTNIFAPPNCASCGIFLQKKTILCCECEKEIIPIVSQKLVITEKFGINVYAMAQYFGSIRSLILKKHIPSYRASTQLGKLMLERVVDPILNCDIIVPIPIYWARKAKRGFNQAKVIADILSEQNKKPVFDILRRTRWTKYQAKLNKKERCENVLGAFSLKPGGEECSGKRLLLVDDLTTTGATLKEAACKLKKLNPESIDAVVAARAV